MSIKLMTLAWDIPVPLATKLVFISLADKANDQNVCWPSLDYIANRCGMHRRTVQRAVLDLEEAGFIVARKREGRSTWYEFKPRVMREAVVIIEGDDTESRVSQSPKGDGTKSQGGNSVPPITTINPQLSLEAPPKAPQGGRMAVTQPIIGDAKYSREFEEFWECWPKGKGGTKAKGYMAWLKLKLDGADKQAERTRLHFDLDQRKQFHRPWLDGFAIPHVSSYLNGGGWTADIDTSTGPKTNGRAKTSYEQVMEASERNRAALREDYDAMSDDEQRTFRAAFGHS